MTDLRFRLFMRWASMLSLYYLQRVAAASLRPMKTEMRLLGRFILDLAAIVAAFVVPISQVRAADVVLSGRCRYTRTLNCEPAAS
jgi:hypothetical protein